MHLGEGGHAFKAVLHPVTGVGFITSSGLAFRVESLSLECFVGFVF